MIILNKILFFSLKKGALNFLGRISDNEHIHISVHFIPKGLVCSRPFSLSCIQRHESVMVSPEFMAAETAETIYNESIKFLKMNV